MKLLSKMLWITDALHLAQTHNRNRHLGEKCAEIEVDESSDELLDRVTRRYKVVCKECKDGQDQG